MFEGQLSGRQAISTSVSIFPHLKHSVHLHPTRCELYLENCAKAASVQIRMDCNAIVSEFELCVSVERSLLGKIQANETVGNSWTVLKVVLGHKYNF